MKMHITAIALLTMLLSSGCMPLTSSQPAPLIYALHGPPMPERRASEKVLHVIAIREPEVPAGFDTDKIALYLHNGRQLNYYANAAWPEHLGKVLQDVILQSARQLPRTMAVTGNSGLPASNEIWIKVNHLEPVYAAEATEPPQLRVSLSFRLLSSASGKALLETTHAATTPANGNTRTAVISGLEALLLAVNKKALREIYRALDKRSLKKRPAPHKLPE